MSGAAAIGPAIQSATDITTSMMGIGAEALGGVLNRQYGRSMMRSAYARTKEMMQNRYQWAVDDLRAAGLNPIIAAQGALGGAPVGSVSPGAIPRSGLEGAASSLLQARLLGAQIASLRADARKKDAEAVIKETKGPIYKGIRNVLEDVVGDLQKFMGSAKGGAEIVDQVKKKADELKLTPTEPKPSKGEWYDRWKSEQNKVYIEPNRPDTSRGGF